MRCIGNIPVRPRVFLSRHLSRNAVIGKPSAQQASDYARYHDIYLAAADRLRPGVAVGELYDFVAIRAGRVDL